MAMNGNTMGTAVANAVIHADAPPEVKAEVVKLWQKICTEIVDHITTNAVVPAGIAVSVSVDPNSHQGGGATSGPGSVT